ncbi:hypothetical protein GWK47_045074 [Chionoecetes opilio]|uniref:Uncharacterized protein n=1 Tax=Chionoecetes opilio TaxID=41210 RepID=A0A8J4Y8I7_CHIOP|nr:hypothetical protein GWK47_045074 [Chionoecetes opilio]
MDPKIQQIMSEMMVRDPVSAIVQTPRHDHPGSVFPFGASAASRAQQRSVACRRLLSRLLSSSSWWWWRAPPDSLFECQGVEGGAGGHGLLEGGRGSGRGIPGTKSGVRVLCEPLLPTPHPAPGWGGVRQVMSEASAGVHVRPSPLSCPPPRPHPALGAPFPFFPPPLSSPSSRYSAAAAGFPFTASSRAEL